MGAFGAGASRASVGGRGRPLKRVMPAGTPVLEYSGQQPLMYNCTYVRTEWDPGKARLNVRKHGISFADAVACLEDEGALTMPDRFSETEERWLTMGLDALGRLVVVVYT